MVSYGRRQRKLRVNQPHEQSGHLQEITPADPPVVPMPASRDNVGRIAKYDGIDQTPMTCEFHSFSPHTSMSGVLGRTQLEFRHEPPIQIIPHVRLADAVPEIQEHSDFQTWPIRRFHRSGLIAR